MKYAISLLIALLGNAPAAAVEIVAHRGASDDAPENTLAALRLGFEQQADAGELDIRLTADRRLVLMHDASTKRTAGLDKPVVEQTLAELQRLDAGSWKDARFAGEKAPALDDVVAEIPQGKRLFIEIKCGEEALPELARVLAAAKKPAAQTAIIGFDYETMLAAKKQHPELHVYWVVGYKKSKATDEYPALADLIARANDAGFDGLDLDYKFPLDAAAVAAVKQAGLKLYVWTVNDGDIAARLAAAGVDGITTDRPGDIRRHLAQAVDVANDAAKPPADDKDWQKQAEADAREDRTTIIYDGVSPNKMVCDTTLRELPDGTWVLFFLAGGDTEPSPLNYTAVSRSTDQGRTWSKAEAFDTTFPREGKTIGQGPTELMIVGNRATLLFSTHSKHWNSDWRSWMMHSDDSGRSWSKPIAAPGRLQNRTFLRNHIVARDGRIIVPFQHYVGPDDEQSKPPLERAFTNPRNGVIISTDGGQTWTEHGNIRITENDRYFGWAENNIVELSDGRIAMIIRADKLGGVLYYAESTDGGRTWPEFARKSDIPNPGSKATLYPLGGDTVAILHNPNPAHRSPMALWISFDGLKTWPYRRVLQAESCDGPKGRMNYPDGFVSKDKQYLHFAFDDNRHRAVYYGAKLPPLPQTPAEGDDRRGDAPLPLPGDPQAAVEKAHAELWRRFVDPHNVVLDYTDLDGTYLRPTPEDCRAHKPSALSWGVPIEDGPMFNGLYLDAAVNRWKLTGNEADRAKGRRLIGGLLLLSSLGETRGFIARGVATDGRTTYPMGSNDQTTPWLYGIWRYLHEGLATSSERELLVVEFSDMVKALHENDWRMPCDGGPSPFRGSFAHFAWEGAPRLLFVLKAMHELTGDDVWRERYLAAARERGGNNNRSRLEICRTGMVFDPGQGPRHSWTGSEGVVCLRALWEMERDPELRAAYAAGLRASAELSAKSLPLCDEFDNAGTEHFEMDWRVMNEAWKPQASEAETVAVANAGLRVQHRASPRLHLEKDYVREPCFAAWVVTLCPDEALVAKHRAAIERVIAHYDVDRLYLSQFFPVEAAWYRLAMAEADTAKPTPAAATSLQFREHLVDLQSNYSAGAAIDVDRDSKLDIVTGGAWYRAPDWTKQPVRDVEFIRGRYDDYACLPLDVNADGWTDFLISNYRSEKLGWVEHPGKSLGKWAEHVVERPGPMETGRLYDVDDDGKLDLLPNGRDFAAWWEIIPPAKAGGEPKFVRHDLPAEIVGHGIGCGDVNGDGRSDLVGPNGWLEAPLDRKRDRWLWHADFQLDRDASVPIIVTDVDSDGDADIVWGRGHRTGLWWLEQTPPAGDSAANADQPRRWTPHAIDTSWSQPHTLEAADLDGDGKPEIIAGKRYLGHDGNDPGEWDPLVIYWYKFLPATRTFERGYIRTWWSYGEKVAGAGFDVDPKLVDLDGDGDIDVLAPGRSGLYWFENLRLGSTASGSLAPSYSGVHPRDRMKLLIAPSRDLASAQEVAIQTSAEWGHRRAQIKSSVEQVMGALPEPPRRVALDVKIISEEDAGKYVRQKISFASEPGDRVPAWLLVPKDLKKPAPAMLCLHQTTKIGKDEPAGLGGLKTLHYAHELAERGYICIVPDYPSFGEYEYDFKLARHTLPSGSMKAIWNNIRAIDVLETRGDVDRERIGVIGHSLGGHNAIFTAAFDLRIRAVVTSCGFTPFHDYYGGKLAGWTSDRYMPRIRDEYGNDPDRVPFDFNELVAVIAPRPFFTNSPLHDDNFDAGGVRKAMASAGEVYKLLNAADVLHAEYPDTGHEFPDAVRKQAYDWLDENLRPKKK